MDQDPDATEYGSETLIYTSVSHPVFPDPDQTFFPSPDPDQPKIRIRIREKKRKKSEVQVEIYFILYLAVSTLSY